MKFAHTFNETLSSQGFPPEWQAAAIQYRQLKKCIKRVQQELAELGLNVDTLRALISECGDSKCNAAGPTLQYMFDGTMQSFQPKLVLTVHGRGLKLDLGLAEETRVALERLLQQREGREGNKRLSTISVGSEESSESENSDEAAAFEASSNDSDTEELPAAESLPVSTVEIPLSHDTEFFQILTSELSALDKVQAQAATAIENEIITIGNSVTTVATPSSMAPRSDLYPWREIFRIYLETGVFFSNLEIERHKERSVEEAQARLQKFSAEVERLGLRKSFKQRNSQVLFQQFMDINEEVLRVLRFQAINKMAMMKILKKFDKRTALGARESFPIFVASNPFLASHLAKAVCFTMSSKLLTILPQLEDYLCPICQSIAVKPVRLSCSHVFCVRCLVKLQRESKRACPMCRSEVVLQANATNLDISLLNFLRCYFPKEAKEKQKENDNEVVQEQWGNVRRASVTRQANGPDLCVIM